jgi:predicted PilT family ATPase
LTVAFDTSFLLYLLAPAGQVGAPLDENGSPIPFVKERVASLVSDLEKAGTKVLVPTPALSEIMVRAGVEAGQGYIALMKRTRVFRIVPFDEKAAIETAIMAGDASKHPKVRAATDGTYAKIKYDRQIVAIAVTEGATTLFTDDRNQQTFAKRHGLRVMGIGDCLVPAIESQMNLALEAPKNI